MAVNKSTLGGRMPIGSNGRTSVRSVPCNRVYFFAGVPSYALTISLKF